MIKKTMILTAILFTLCSNLQAQDLTRTDVIKLIAIATKPLDLTGTSLFNIGVSKLNLKGANLSYANLSYANLTGANLTGANLTNAKLIYTDSTGVLYQNSKTNFTGANLTGVIGYKP